MSKEEFVDRLSGKPWVKLREIVEEMDATDNVDRYHRLFYDAAVIIHKYGGDDALEVFYPLRSQRVRSQCIRKIADKFEEEK